MDAITAVKPGIWSWKGKDPDYGFEIIGHVVRYGTGLAAVDPPETPGGVEEVRALGEVRLVAITSAPHVRGGPKLAKALGVPLVAPPSARGELAEAGATAATEVYDGDGAEGWRVIGLHVAAEGKVWDEVAYYSESQRLLVVGDVLTEREGELIVQPPEFYEISPRHFAAPLRKLANLRVETLCTGHSQVIDRDVTARLRALLDRLQAG